MTMAYRNACADCHACWRWRAEKRDETRRRRGSLYLK